MAFFGRSKNKIQNRLTLIDIYNQYIQDKEEESPYHLDKDTYKELLHSYIKLVIDYIFLESGEYRFPGKLGTFFVEKKKTCITNKIGCFIDWKATNEYGKTIYHFNEHTHGFKYKFHWRKHDLAVPNIRLYKFVLTRSNKRRLAKLIKSGEYDYKER